MTLLLSDPFDEERYDFDSEELADIEAMFAQDGDD